MMSIRREFWKVNYSPVSQLISPSPSSSRTSELTVTSERFFPRFIVAPPPPIGRPLPPPGVACRTAIATGSAVERGYQRAVRRRLGRSQLFEVEAVRGSASAVVMDLAGPTSRVASIVGSRPGNHVWRGV